MVSRWLVVVFARVLVVVLALTACSTEVTLEADDASTQSEPVAQDSASSGGGISGGQSADEDLGEPRSADAVSAVFGVSSEPEPRYF